jgi:opacity protein-like surface antigen
MKLVRIFTILAALPVATLSAQNIQVGILAGGSNYLGELQERSYDLRMARLTLGGSFTYLFSNRIAVRGTLLKGNLVASDQLSSNVGTRNRNLSFATRLYEASVVGKYSFLDLSNSIFTPYVIGGVAAFRTNPYTFAADATKQYLIPLSTEGQGMPQYPDQQKMKLWQFSLPLGAGLEFKLNDHFSVELEVAYRKTFTDYIDDVSTVYINPTFLLAERGPRAVELAYRGGELPGGNTVFPREGAMRGNPKTKDWYYTTLLRLNYIFGGRNATNAINGFQNAKGRKQYDCPSNW